MSRNATGTRSGGQPLLLVPTVQAQKPCAETPGFEEWSVAGGTAWEGTPWTWIASSPNILKEVIVEVLVEGPSPSPRRDRVTEDASNKLMRGTVDLVVLRALTRGPMHGFAIARWIREHGEEVVTFEDAALYQSLHRLERQELVESSWGRSENNRRARFYTLTEKGRGRLESETNAFRNYVAAITRLLEARP